MRSLAPLFPESGGAVRYGHYSHGSLVGFVAGWAAWIAIVSVIPVEAEASVHNEFLALAVGTGALHALCPWSRRVDGAGALDLRGARRAVFSWSISGA